MGVVEGVGAAEGGGWGVGMKGLGGVWTGGHSVEIPELLGL